MHRVHRQNPPNKHSEGLQRDINDLRLAQRINRAKADVDNGPPPPLPHLDTRGKQRQIEKERQSEIEQNNRTLLTRIEHHFTSGKTVDCHLVQYGPRSLNRISRENELRRITQENRRLHNAIINQKPVIVAAKLESDFEKNQKAFEHLCQNKVVMNKVDNKKDQYNQQDEDEIQYQGQIEEEIRQKLEQEQEKKQEEQRLDQSQSVQETQPEKKPVQNALEDLLDNTNDPEPAQQSKVTEAQMPSPFEFSEDEIIFEKDDGFTGQNVYLTQ